MSKKPRGKSGSAAGGGGNKWEAGLLAAAVDEVRISLCIFCSQKIESVSLICCQSLSLTVADS